MVESVVAETAAAETISREGSAAKSTAAWRNGRRAETAHRGRTETTASTYCCATEATASTDCCGTTAKTTTAATKTAAGVEAAATTSATAPHLGRGDIRRQYADRGGYH
jgi:hypothetical protein